MLAAVALVCQCVGAAVLLSLLCWLVVVALQKGRSRTLLDRLPTRAVLITGCDSGFGHALARRLDALGVPVLAGCLFPEGTGAGALAADCSSRLRVLPLDVTSDQQVADAVASVQAALNDHPGTELWAVVNNAGVGDLGEISFTPLEKFQRVLDVNTVGAIRVTKAFLPLLKRSKGRVINITSPFGKLPFPIFSAYCLSKSALASFSDVLRLEMKKWSVTVSTLDPSMYGTPITDTDCLKSTFIDNVNRTAVDVQEEKDTVKYCEKILGWMKWFSRGDISEVVDEMVVACVGRNVQRKHSPTFKDAILYTAFAMTPDWLRDLEIELLISAIKVIWK